MKHLFEALIFAVLGTGLLWFGYTLFFRIGLPAGGSAPRPTRRRGRSPKAESMPGDPQTCPVCSAKLDDGQLVKSAAFPSMNGGKDRFMHIRGCAYCLRGDRERVCPVCGIVLRGEEILIARLFERPGRRSHVHVLGCSRCRGPQSGRRGY
jgi:hypothetical protein